MTYTRHIRNVTDNTREQCVCFCSWTESNYRKDRVRAVSFVLLLFFLSESDGKRFFFFFFLKEDVSYLVGLTGSARSPDRLGPRATVSYATLTTTRPFDIHNIHTRITTVLRITTRSCIPGVPNFRRAKYAGTPPCAVRVF